MTATFVSVLLLLPPVAMQLVNFGRANPNIWDHPYSTIVEWKEEGEIPPPEGTLPPVISIASPQNNTSYASSDISLTLSASLQLSNTVSFQMSELYCVPSWQVANNKLKIDVSEDPITQTSITLNDVPEGSHWLQVHAVASAVAYVTDRKTSVSQVWDRSRAIAYGSPKLLGEHETTTIYYVSYKIASSSLVKFTIDKTAPEILSVSVENKTYSTSDVQLNVVVNEPASRVTYSLDGQSNRTTAGNTTLTDLSNGEHTLAVSVLDFAGNVGSLETVYFTVDEPEPFPIMTVAAASAASVAVIGIGLLGYFKKRKH